METFTMNHSEIALARSRAYSLFSQLLSEGLTEETYPIVKQVPEFAELEEQDTAEWAASHHQLFRMNVFPYETIFRDTDGLLGGDSSEIAAGFYHAIGFSPSQSDNADGIAVELSALAFLCAAESDAHEDEMPHEAQRMRHFQRRFLDEHLLCWLPALTKAIINQGDHFYNQLADMLLKLTLEHRAALGDDLLNPPQAFTLPDLPELLSQDKTGLRDIARYLLTPAYSGFYLSQEDIKAIGNHFGIPRGFGKRLQVLSNLFRTAVDYDSLDAVLKALQDVAGDWREFYANIETASSIEPIIQVWDSRLAKTQRVLNEISAAIEQINIEDNAEE